LLFCDLKEGLGWVEVLILRMRRGEGICSLARVVGNELNSDVENIRFSCECE
jgi:hypothetical protein